MAAPQAGQNQLLSRISAGLFDRWEGLRVNLLETGVAWVPWFMWRLDQQYRELRAEVPWVKQLPSDHMRRAVRVSTQPMTDVNAKNFMKLVEMAESDRMYLFATDYPHYDADSISVLNGVDKELQDRIRYKNALESFPRMEKLING
jgi:predicted TIM-barrel fold metal-dependent hydrolase